jgi:hypothetical protein
MSRGTDRAKHRLGAVAMALALSTGSLATIALATGAPALADIYEDVSEVPAAPLILASGALAQLTPPASPGMPLEVRQSIGCLVVGATGTTVTLAGGGLGLVTALAGGVGAPSAGALTIGLTGLVFGTFCAVGAVMTPLYVYLTAPRQAPRQPAQERHAMEPRVPLAGLQAEDVRSAAFRSGVLNAAYTQRDPPR